MKVKEFVQNLLTDPDISEGLPDLYRKTCDGNPAAEDKAEMLACLLSRYVKVRPPKLTPEGFSLRLEANNATLAVGGDTEAFQGQFIGFRNLKTQMKKWFMGSDIRYSSAARGLAVLFLDLLKTYFPESGFYLRVLRSKQDHELPCETIYRLMDDGWGQQEDYSTDSSFSDIEDNAHRLPRYLFSYRPESGRLKSAEVFEGWLGISESVRQAVMTSEFALAAFGKKIIREARRFPMFDYMLKHNFRDRDNVVETLKATVSIADSSETPQIRPPIQALIQRVREGCAHHCRSKSYSARDFMLALGQCAEDTQIHAAKAGESADSSKYRLVTDSLNSMEIPEGMSEGTWNELTEDIRTAKAPFLTMMDDNRSPIFSVQQYRLIFAAYYAADQCEKNGNAEHLMSVLTGGSKGNGGYLPRASGDTPKHRPVDERFEVICFFGVAAAMFLGSRRRSDYLERLMELAGDFRVSQRQVQIGAIYILSYMLCELELDSAERERIYCITYGKTIYPLQIRVFEFLRQRSPYYQDRIHKSVQDACQITMSRKAAAQPLFLLAFGMLDPLDEGVLNTPSERAKIANDPDTFLKTASQLQYLTWRDAGENTEQRMKSLLDLLGHISNRKIPYRIPQSEQELQRSLKYAYGVSLLGWALADLINSSDMGCERMKKLLPSNEDGKNPLFMFLLADYYIRDTNEVYCSEGGKTRHRDMYLLCGSYRVQRALDSIEAYFYGTDALFHASEICARYAHWLQEELECADTQQPANIRYAWLLSRLVSYFGANDAYNASLSGNIKKLIERIERRTSEYLSDSSHLPVFLDYDHYPVPHDA